MARVSTTINVFLHFFSLQVTNMICKKWLLFSAFLLGFIVSTSYASSPYYDTVSNLTHTCNISPMVVCVDINANITSACIDPKCLINSEGNISSCMSPLITTNLQASSNGTINATGNNSSTNTNSTTNATTQICNAMWIYPSNNKSFCFNSSSWNKTVCNKNNVTCKINRTYQCTLNPVVYFGGFFNLKDKDGYGNIPAAELALNQINNDNKTLKDITLSLVAKQSTQVINTCNYWCRILN